MNVFLSLFTLDIIFFQYTHTQRQSSRVCTFKGIFFLIYSFPFLFFHELLISIWNLIMEKKKEELHLLNNFENITFFGGGETIYLLAVTFFIFTFKFHLFWWIIFLFPFDSRNWIQWFFNFQKWRVVSHLAAFKTNWVISKNISLICIYLFRVRDVTERTQWTQVPSSFISF